MIRFVCSLRPFSVTLPFPGEEHGRVPVGPELREEFKAYPVINVLDQIIHARRGFSLQWGRRSAASRSGRDLEPGRRPSQAWRAAPPSSREVKKNTEQDGLLTAAAMSPIGIQLLGERCS